MNILIADDHQLFIDGMAFILKQLDADAAITQVNSAEQAISSIESTLKFDLILIDLSMPGMSGLSILQRVQARNVWLPLIVISSEEDIYTIKSALDAGALGFIPKSHSSQQMINALHSILNGDIYIPEDIEQKLDKLHTRRPPDEASHNSLLKNSGITRRQYEVLQLLARGYSNKQIAISLFLTEHTVKAHISALFSALQASNRTECVQLATNQGILTGNQTLEA